MTRNSLRPPGNKAQNQEAPALLRGTMRSLSRVAPGLAARLAADLFMRPHRSRPRGRELNWLRDARPEKLPTRFGGLAGWSWGEGPTVVLVHGWNGRGSQLGLVAQAIADVGFRALALDGPAHGHSSGRRTNLIDFSAALVDICSGLPDLHGLVGHSFGALSFSYRWSELPPINRLVMISPPADMKTYSRMFIQAVGGSDQVHDKMLALYRRKFNITWDDLTVESLAPRLETPLLIVHDKEDRQAPLNHGRRTQQAWPVARLHETEKLGHMRILRDDGVAELIATFLAEGSA